MTMELAEFRASAAARGLDGKKTCVAALAAALLATACGEASAPPPPPPDVSAAVERLGNPFAIPSFYARNVWDMQLFGGRIYLGHGDSIDNWGPIAIWSLDPAGGAFASEFTTSEEQVDIFRVLGGALHVPGHDPRDDWSLGNFYRLEGGGWVKHRTIPHGLHTFDLAVHDGLLVAALGAEDVPDQKSLLASADGGRTWAPSTEEFRRIYDLFELAGELYAAPELYDDPDPARGALLRFDGGRFVPTGIAGASVVGALPPGTRGRMLRAVEFKGALAYVVTSETFDWVPVALAVTRTLRDTRTATLPNPAAVPYDLLVRGSTLYALAAAPAAGGGYTVYVYATTELVTWREVFRFHAPTFARSFEEHAGDFYFGLGSTYATPSDATGDILRVRRAAYAAR